DRMPDKAHHNTVLNAPMERSNRYLAASGFRSGVPAETGPRPAGPRRGSDAGARTAAAPDPGDGRGGRGGVPPDRLERAERTAPGPAGDAGAGRGGHRADGLPAREGGAD